jgi:hypothetical protein
MTSRELIAVLHRAAGAEFVVLDVRRRADRLARAIREQHSPPCWDCPAGWSELPAPPARAIDIRHQASCPTWVRIRATVRSAA